MGEVEGVVVTEIRFEVPDGMFKSLSVGQVLTDSLLNQSGFSAQDIPMGKSVDSIVPGDALVLEDQCHGKRRNPAFVGLLPDVKHEAVRQILNPSLERHFCR
jgi:hypothetical protein